MQPFTDLVAALQRFGAADLIPAMLHDASPVVKVLFAVFVLLVPGMLTTFALILLTRKLYRLRRDRRSVEVPAAVAAAEVQMEVVRVLPVVRGR